MMMLHPPALPRHLDLVEQAFGTFTIRRCYCWMRLLQLVIDEADEDASEFSDVVADVEHSGSQALLEAGNEGANVVGLQDGEDGFILVDAIAPDAVEVHGK